MSATVWHGTRYTITSKEGKRTYRGSPKICKDCPCKTACGANESGQRILTTHIWQEYLNLLEELRKIERGKELYVMRKETMQLANHHHSNIGGLLLEAINSHQHSWWLFVA